MSKVIDGMFKEEGLTAYDAMEEFQQREASIHAWFSTSLI
jgi:hypothetical protein